MDQFLENGQFTVNEILNFSNNYKFEMNGKEMSLAEYKPGLWAPTDANGVQGKYITEAFKAKEKRSKAIISGVNQTVGKLTDGLLERVKGGEKGFTLDEICKEVGINKYKEPPKK